ncbi:MAG: CPBP family intramembrane metalloprotease [Nitrospiraceae bacterium]|nr:CPBP family intramembrane metalloprotease [Nitrospiraceae bacterium]
MKDTIVKILFLAAVLFASIAVFTGTERLMPLWAGGLLAAVLIFRKWDVLHAALLLFMLSILIYLPGFIGMPTVKSLFPLLASTLLVLPFPAARETLLWAKAGRLDRTSVLIIIFIAAVSAAALVLWANWAANLPSAGLGHPAHGRLPAAGLEVAGAFMRWLPSWLVAAIGVPVFALFNALAEEGIYRGVLQKALGRAFGEKTPALLLQASAFAAVHYRGGFPSGPLGYVMALAYGLVLGYLRRRSGGMLAPCLAHIMADLTIGYILVSYA